MPAFCAAFFSLFGLQTSRTLPLTDLLQSLWPWGRGTRNVEVALAYREWDLWGNVAAGPLLCTHCKLFTSVCTHWRACGPVLLRRGLGCAVSQLILSDFIYFFLLVLIQNMMKLSDLLSKGEFGEAEKDVSRLKVRKDLVSSKGAVSVNMCLCWLDSRFGMFAVSFWI